MTESPETILARQLGAGETLLWSGRPRGGLRLRPQDAALIPFSLLWGGFSFFWEASVFRTGAPFFFKLWGVPFVCVGLYVIFGRFFVDAAMRARTTYGVTNERIVILSGLLSPETKSLSLRTLGDVSLSERGDRSGTITFGSGPAFAIFYPGGAWPGSRRNMPPAFEMIEHAKEVYDIVRQAQKTAS